MEVADHLRSCLDIRQYRNTRSVEARVYHADPTLAETFNALVALHAARWQRAAPWGRNPVRIVTLGKPGVRPIRPNRPLWIHVGALGASALALLTALAAALIPVVVARVRATHASADRANGAVK